LNLEDDTAESVTLKFSGGGLTSSQSNAIGVSPAPASKLVIQTQPSSTATAGQAFPTQPVIYEEDQYGNLETGDSSTVVSASLASGAGPLQGVTTATLTDGVATFASLSDRLAESITLRFLAGSLSSQASSAIQNTAPAPTAHVTIATTKSKKSISTVITIQYSTAMDPASTGLSANYVLAATTGKGKKKKTTEVAFTARFVQSTNIVTLTVTGKNNAFPSGGVLTISGVKSLAGVFLSQSPLSFAISANAKTITP
jgi:hypothetical protein